MSQQRGSGSPVHELQYGQIGRREAVARRCFTSSPFHQKRVSVAELLQHDVATEDVEITGWVRSVRKQKRIAFAAVDDGTTVDSVQAVLTPEQAALYV